MDFNQLVNEKLVPAFLKNGLRETEVRKNFFKFESSCVEVIISYDLLDKSNLIVIGEKNDFLYQLNEKALKIVFGLDLKIDQVPKEVFIQNLVLFFQNNGSMLLICNSKKLIELASFVENESKTYTDQILKSQYISQLNEAWEIGDYLTFVSLIDQTKNLSLPESFKLKYKIAKKKISLNDKNN